MLAAGYGVVADAVFDRPAEREAIAGLAADAGVAFHGIWLDAPEAALLERLAARRNDPSDATAEVLLAQLQRDCGDDPLAPNRCRRPCGGGAGRRSGKASV